MGDLMENFVLMTIIKSHFSYLVFQFHFGLACFELARTLKNRKYLLQARKITKMMQSQERLGNPNSRPYLYGLRAEDVAAKTDSVVAVGAAYNHAIAAARLLPNLSALLNERAARNLQRIRNGNCPHRIELYARRSIRHYSNWGAKRKAREVKTYFEPYL
mmetsp:Transcript_13017/g.18717  ORF Transcript_13017/g.18717 Transcript_13017/m.18717 type:complete len:160 (-) Transcript_13017:344-823(-)